MNFRREITPAAQKVIPEELMVDGRQPCHLPAHPNIVETQVAFVDAVPDLPGGGDLYPDALPRRLNPNGCGRNMSLFLVMKKYDCNLRQFMERRRQSSIKWKESLVLLTQLLEGIRTFVYSTGFLLPKESLKMPW